MQRVIETGRKAVLILPYVSLAREKMFHLQAVLEGTGKENCKVEGSVADPDPNPDPSDPFEIGPPGSGSGSINQRCGSGSFYHQAKIVRKTLIPTVF